MKKKGDIGVAKRFSKKYRNKGWAFNCLQYEINVMSRCLSAPDATSLYITAFRTIINIYYLKLNLGIGHYDVF